MRGFLEIPIRAPSPRERTTRVTPVERRCHCSVPTFLRCPRVCPGSGAAAISALPSPDCWWCPGQPGAWISSREERSGAGALISAWLGRQLQRRQPQFRASHASSESAEPLLCNERQRWPPGAPEPSALKPPQIFCFSNVPRSFWMFTGCSVGLSVLKGARPRCARVVSAHPMILLSAGSVPCLFPELLEPFQG